MVVLPDRKVFGARIRILREERGWSQSTTARRIPLSQKQWSRLELGDVSFLDRHLLIRLGEIFETPIMTGELNRWLHSSGYRPHMVPLLPLPPNHEDLLAQYEHNPAVIMDIGWYFRYANASMERLYHTRVKDLSGVQRNWMWHYFRADGLLRKTYPPGAEERILNRLFWDWRPYYQERWMTALIDELESALGITWRDLAARYHIPSEPLAGAQSELITVLSDAGVPLLFQNQMRTIPSRPDLYITVYRPMNVAASAWCRQLEMQGAV